MKMQRLLLAAAVSMAAATAARGGLIHRYSFNDTSTTTTPDAVGTATATLVNGATDNGTQVATTGGGSGSAGTSPAAQLPSAAVSGISGDFAIESYFTAATTDGNFATLFNFSDATNGTYFIATPNRASATGVSSIAAKYNGGAETVVQGANLNNGAQHQFLASYTSSTGSVSLFVDGALVGGPTVIAGAANTFNLSLLTNREGVNGLAGFPDPAMTGSTNDFRIYNNTITAAQALALNTAGPDASNAVIQGIVPEPGSIGVAAAAGLGLLLRRRRTAV